MGIDLGSRGWEPAETRETPVDARHVHALRSRLAAMAGGERVPAGSIIDAARSVAPMADALERNGPRTAARAARTSLSAHLAGTEDYPFPEPSDYDERLDAAPLAGSDRLGRATYG